MERFFNTEGPCRPEDHYMLPAEERLGTEVERLIERKRYFVVHAPRQVGKTTAFRSLAERLTAEGDYAALLTTCEIGQRLENDVDSSLDAVLGALRLRASEDLPGELQPPAPDPKEPTGTRLWDFLRRWAQACPRPLVLFFDEIDALYDDALLTVLRQLRAGYGDRPQSFPHAVALIGLRDVRDYRLLASGGDGERLGTSSPFNVKARSLLLRDFNAKEVTELYDQHSQATGQEWTNAAKNRAFELTRGQPWLVNALADQITGWDVTDRTITLDLEHVESAREKLIQRRDTHLDSLVARLREPRVQRVVAPILAGEALAAEVMNDDVQFVKDLGLVTSGLGGLEISNPIYREIVPRVLTEIMEESIALPQPSYLGEDGRLDFDRLIDDFCAFWLANAEEYLGRSPYSEAAAQLVFQAFLHKITNGSGHGAVDREYAAGRGRLDLCVRWPRPEGGFDRWAIELKVWRDTGARDPIKVGKEQLAAYLERLGLDEGILMIFDARTASPPLSERMTRTEEEHDGKRILVLML